MASEKSEYNKEWLGLSLFAMIVLVMGTIGFLQHGMLTGDRLDFADAFYRAIQLFTLESGAVSGKVPILLEIARWMAPLTTIFAAIKGFFSVIKGRGSLFRLHGFHDHAIVCGIGQKGLTIATGLLDRGTSVVLVDLEPENSQYKDLMKRGAIYLSGNATDPNVLSTAKLGTAGYLIATTGSDMDNVSIIRSANRLISTNRKDKPKTGLNCFAHIGNPELLEIFYQHPIFANSSKRFNAQVFNLYNRGARVLFEEHAPDRYSPIRSETDPMMHIILFGFSPLATSLILQAARVGHYANNRKLRVTVVDKMAQEKIGALCLPYPALEDILEIETRNLDIECMSTVEWQMLLTEKPASIYVCADSDVLGISIARRIRRELGYDSTPVIVGLLQNNTIAELVQDDDLLAREGITIFPLIDRTSNVENMIGTRLDALAIAVHNYYLEQMTAKGESVKTNPSLIAWEELPESIKDSNRYQADHLQVKLRSVGYTPDRMTHETGKCPFTDAQVETLARMEHNRWMADRLLSGWRYEKGEKNLERKTSPTLVPWEELSADEQDKDHDVIRNIPKLLNHYLQTLR